MTNGIYILLGSNLGDKLLQLTKASKLLKRQVGNIITQSKIYETAAWGKTDQPTFYNQVILVQSGLSPIDLLLTLNKIEKDLGRTRKEKWGGRTIDLDILYFGDQVIDKPTLHIPHPGIPDRKFTLIPLVEIAPDFVHPTLNKTNVQLLADTTDKLAVRQLNP